MNDNEGGSETYDSLEPDVLDLVEAWRQLDFPEPAAWDDEPCRSSQNSLPFPTISDEVELPSTCCLASMSASTAEGRDSGTADELITPPSRTATSGETTCRPLTSPSPSPDGGAPQTTSC